MKIISRLTAICVLAFPALAFANAALQYPPFSPDSALTLYVSPTGNDAITGVGNNNCMDNTYPCLTLQRAVDQISNDTLVRGQTITISMADGTYTSGFRADYGTVFTIQGNCSTPTNVVLGDTSANAAAMIATNNAAVEIRCLKVSSTNGSLLFADTHGLFQVLDNVIFGSAHYGQLHAENAGLIQFFNSYTIAGSAPAHFQPVLGGFIELPDSYAATVTLSGTPAFSTAFADVESGGRLYVSSGAISFSGSATGPRYIVRGNGVIETLAGSPTFLPGNSLGQEFTNGVYLPTPTPSVAATNLGTGGSGTLYANSSDYTGSVKLNTGSAATGNSGDVTLTYGGKLGTADSECSATLGGGTTQWDARASLRIKTTSQSQVVLTWDNNGNNLALNTDYRVNYNCNGINTW